MNITKRLVCPQCERTFSVDRDGLLNKHRLRSGGPCLGSGCDPATNLAPAKGTATRPSRPAPRATPSEFRPIAHIETSLHDTVRDRWEEGTAVGGVRLYSTASAAAHGKENARWALQVRAQVKTKRNGQGKHFAIGTASMSREDLQWLRDQINAALRRTR